MANSIMQDFSKLRLTLPTLRVDDLKSIIRDINSCLLVSARVTGRKDELIHRIEGYLQEAIGTNNTENYARIRAAIYRHCREPFIPSTLQRIAVPTNHSGHRASTGSTSTSIRANAPTVDFGSAPLARLNHFDHSQTKSDPVFGTTSTPSSMIRSHPFKTSASTTPNPTNPNTTFQASPSLNNPPHSSKHIPSFPAAKSPYPSSNHHSPHPSAFSNNSAFNQRSIPINFEKSPFYRIDSAVSMVTICHRAAQNDRKSVTMSLLISAEQKAKISQSTQYQIRMFSTSESFYNLPGYGAPFPVATALIEFPTTLELKLNNCVITSNVRGIKKQPGTAAPPDLALVPGRNGIGQALDLRDGKANQIEIAYSNSDKRFYFILYLVEYFGVYGLLKNLKAAPKRTEEQVLQEILSSSGDEDVIASASVVSLMDPIVFSRIKIPIRSLKCKHVQCFDAEMFYTMMEQTPTWLCPVCNVKINNADILIDEYFESILKAAPSTIDNVIVESDGKWHDERYECGTSVQKKQASMSITSIESGGRAGSTRNGAVDSINDFRHKRTVTVLDLESEDDQDLRISSSHSHKRHKPTAMGFSPNCVIDLTLDD